MISSRYILLTGLLCLASCSAPTDNGNASSPPSDQAIEADQVEIPMDFGAPPHQEVPIFTDTLPLKAFNPHDGVLDPEADVLPAYHEEFNLEIITRTEPEPNEYWGEGLISLTNYGLSFREVSLVDEKGGKWYDTFDIFRFRFTTEEQATLEFNRHIKGLNAYNDQPLQGQGWETRRVLTRKEIYLIEGSCKTTWFVRDATNRIIWMSQARKGISPKTMIRTFCGGGAALNSKRVVPPEPIRKW